MQSWIAVRWRQASGAGRVVPVLLAVALVGAATLAFSRGGEGSARYRTVAATVADLESTTTALGKVRPRDYVDVGAQVSGQLERVLVQVGDGVEQGQLLAEIDATVLEAKVAAGRAQLKELEANLAEQRAEAKLARSRADRNWRLQAGDAVSEDEAQASQAQLEIATARLAGLEAQIERVRSTLEGDQANLSYTKIYAPMSGTVVSQSALEGQTLNANQTTPTLLRIADLSQMTVHADVSEADVTRLSPGMPVYFNTLGAPERRWRTRLRQVLPEPEIVNDVVLYKALLDVENPDRALLPEMTAQVFFQLGQARDALTVPLTALRGALRGDERRGPRGSRSREGSADTREPGRDREAALPEGATRMWVTVLLDGEPEPREVLVGLRNRTSAQILSGLEPGDTLVVGTLDPRSEESPDSDSRSFRGLRRML